MSNDYKQNLETLFLFLGNHFDFSLCGTKTTRRGSSSRSLCRVEPLTPETETSGSSGLLCARVSAAL